ncbi:DUF2937 family protein [Roseibium algae]|uniref:DUF2937 family protein n=1 Tax=Roseibium algae TaxID=3123038 RepID=A0ABU8TG70_9HYPH
MVRMIMLVFSILCGTATSQLPEFAQQYLQRIGGAIDALQTVMTDFEDDAAAFGLSVDDAITRLKSGDDGFARERGETMEQTQYRLSQLVDQQEALAAAGPFSRLAVVLESMDTKLAKSTAEDYEPALPVTVEGAVSAGVGGLLGFLGLSFLFSLGRFARRRRAPQ